MRSLRRRWLAGIVLGAAVLAAGPAGAPEDRQDELERLHRAIRESRERIARYKCPTSVDFVTELPRNASGKILKRVLRAPYWPG